MLQILQQQLSKDYINQLDKILNSLETNVLKITGSVSHKKAVEKAKSEYEKYQINAALVEHLLAEYEIKLKNNH